MTRTSTHPVGLRHLLIAVLFFTLVAGLPGCNGGSSDAAVSPTRQKLADSPVRYDEDASTPALLPTLAVTLVKQAPKPTGALSQDSSCVTSSCHGSYLVARHVHAPVFAGNCQSCHSDDAGDHTYPLLRNSEQTCTFCHMMTGTRQHQHGALSVDGCLACHDPHVSETQFLLKEPSIDRLCASCHDLPTQKHAHDPFARGQCTLCHRPHQSDSAMLLRDGDGAEHCLSCHDDLKLKLANSPSVHEPADTACDTCHDAHTSEHRYQLHETMPTACFACHEDMAAEINSASVSHDALFIEQQCANCHDPHAAGRPKLLKDRVDRLCLKCHSESIEASDGRTIASMKTVLQQPFLHGPVRSGNCTGCHNVHGASHERLLNAMYPKEFYASFDLTNYALCFQCHNKELVLSEQTRELTDFRDGATNLHYLHVHRQEKGRTCKTCHAMHGSDLPKHLSSEVPFEGSNWMMQINFEKSDDGGRCAPGCHEPMSYQRGQANAVKPPDTKGAAP